MCEKAAVVHECPGCGEVVRDDEDYVVAIEYKLDSGFRLHLQSENRGRGVQRRFHVGHFRGRLGEYFYELVDPSEEDRLPR